jgi:hypothetical protein
MRLGGISNEEDVFGLKVLETGHAARQEEGIDRYSTQDLNDPLPYASSTTALYGAWC